MNKNIVILLCLALAGCKPAQPPSKPGTTSADKARTSAFFCAPGYDYRAFEGLAVWKELDMNDTWKCTASDHLEMTHEWESLAYAQEMVPRPDGPVPKHSLKISIAPGGTLLDPQAHKRMRTMANALGEALTKLRHKPCPETGGLCDLENNPDPLSYPGYPKLYNPPYEIEDEFPEIGRRAWQWRSIKDNVEYRQIIYTSRDGKFDVSLMLRLVDILEDTIDSADDMMSMFPKTLSQQYDERSKLISAVVDGQAK